MYERCITREHRTAFVILIDQSGSMAEKIDYDGRMITKAEAVAEVTNQIIGELIERARRQDGVRDYYDIAVVGYSGEGVTSVLGDKDGAFVSIEDLAARDVDVQMHESQRLTPSGDLISHSVATPMWVLPRAMGETPMYEGLNYTFDAVKDWISRRENIDSFPPIIFNITDGESSDCSPEGMINISHKIGSLSTTDGNAFMINVHIASTADQSSMVFPTFEEVKALTNSKAKELSYASSVMPSIYNDMICEIRDVVGYREFIGVAYNASIAELVTILNIGTISVKKG